MKYLMLLISLLLVSQEILAEEYQGIVANTSEISLGVHPGNPTAENVQLNLGDQDKDSLIDAKFWVGNSAILWNELLRQLIIKNKPVSGLASRAFAILSVAQFDAANIAVQLKHQSKGKMRQGNSSNPSLKAAIAQASGAVLSYLYPRDKEMLERAVKEAVISAKSLGDEDLSDIAAGLEIGAKVAELVIARAKKDRSEINEWQPKARQAGVWFPVGSPSQPSWGKVEPWLTDDITQFRAAAPPAWGSPEFQKALAEVKNYSDQQNARRLSIAQYWDQPRGSVSVPGLWNELGCRYSTEDKLSVLETARVLAYLNMAMMDAGISSWDTKFHYMVQRPSRAMKGIDLPLGLPNHPSYTSGHASFSGAADGVLSGFFPKRAESLHAMAEEASLSRVYGGVHYLFDGVEGLKAGRKIATLALKRAGVAKQP